jgi:hypothetical protein
MGYRPTDQEHLFAGTPIEQRVHFCPANAFFIIRRVEMQSLLSDNNLGLTKMAVVIDPGESAAALVVAQAPPPPVY